MAQLNEKDLVVLISYANNGNRERYWNYLAQHAGSDGYGLLALGVVRNDNMPGAVANAYAQDYARNIHHVELSERGWEEFGRELIRQDIAKRQAYLKDGHPDLALNLPAFVVKEAHAAAFGSRHIGPDAWTPNKLLEAANRKGGEAEMEKVWHTMLDNGSRGIYRGMATSQDILATYGAQQADRFGYLAKLGLAEADALHSAPNTTPDEIRRGIHHYEYDRHRREWNSWVDSDVAEFGFRSPLSKVTDPVLLRDLDDTRAVRLERQQLGETIHPDDPYRKIARSPRTIAHAAPAREEPRQVARHAGRDIDPALYDDLSRRLPADTSPERMAQITLAARQADIRGGDIQGLSMHGDSTLRVHGRRPGDRATVDLGAPPPAIESTLMQADAYHVRQHQAWQMLESQRQQINAQEQAQEQAQERMQAQRLQAMHRQDPSMGGPTIG